MQQPLFEFDHDITPIQLDMPDADVKYYPNFIQKALANVYMSNLRSAVDWRQEHVTVYGKTHKVPRLQAWYGDTDAEYQYSNLTMRPLPWISDLYQLKQRCEQTTNSVFNSVLANLYRDGQDGMGRHADNEPELGDQPVIASLSFGEPRNLDFYHNRTKQKVRINLASGSLLVMRGATQTFWQHAVAKSNKVLAQRINLTFRQVKQRTE